MVIPVPGLCYHAKTSTHRGDCRITNDWTSVYFVLFCLLVFLHALFSSGREIFPREENDKKKELD